MPSNTALRELLSLSLECLFRHRLRTALNMVGVMIGVAAVVAMMSVGEGARREALHQLGQLGLQNLFVEPRALQPMTGRSGYTDGLTAGDAERLEKLLPGIERAVPLIDQYSNVSVDREPKVLRILGITAGYQAVRDLRASAGRLLADDQDSGRQVCVIGGRLVEALFGRRNPIGEALKIHDAWYRVVGVLTSTAMEDTSTSELAVSEHDEAVLVPIAALPGRTAFGSRSPVTHLWLRAANGTAPELAKRDVEHLLRQFHGGVEDFAVMVPRELIAQRLRTQRTFNIIVGSIAVLALLVGGIGIMNTMLAAVLERTSEIGLRRTVGASRQWIVAQFLFESVAMTGAGGIAGVLTGAAVAAAISQWAGWPTHVSATAVVLALVVASLTGIGFGLYPAARAARLEPIDAVRYE